MSKRMRGFFIIACVVCAVSMGAPFSAEASREERDTIRAACLAEKKDVAYVSSLCAGENILNNFAVREKLNGLSYEELCDLKRSTKGWQLSDPFTMLLQRAIFKQEKESIYLLCEDLFIDNQPQSRDAPFYPSSAHHLSALQPDAEYLYFNNVKLTFTPRSLRQEATDWWINPDVVQRSPSLSLDPRPPYGDIPVRILSADEKMKRIGEYRVKDDNLHYFSEIRIWIKKYEEDQPLPVFCDDAVIVRNKHRIWCVDPASQSTVWSLANRMPSGEEHYQTFFPLHQNGYGYGMLVADGMVVTECARKLVAISIADIVHPAVSWETDLGEYLLCTVPVKQGEHIVAGLVNPRKEIWFCGFSSRDGKLEWSTYIGTSSFDTPLCGLSVQKEGRVLIGTNHGFLACLNAADGQIVWIRKYASKKNPLIDFWLGKSYLAKFVHSSSVAFDTQFIESDRDGTLYYKPRESDYLYLIESDSGALREKILVDSGRYYILRASGGAAVLLKKAGSRQKKTELLIVDLLSGNVISRAAVDGNDLKGVMTSRGETIFKLDTAVYSLQEASGKGWKLIRRTADIPAQGWLLNQNGRFLLTGEKGRLSIYAMENTPLPYTGENQSLQAHAQNDQFIRDGFSRLADQTVSAGEKRLLENALRSRILSTAAAAETVAPLILRYKECLRTMAWEEFFVAFSEKYPDSTVRYQDVEMKMTNFLVEEGLLPRKDNAAPPQPQRQLPRGAKVLRYQSYGEKLSLLPITVIEGEKPQGYFLLLNSDQLLCVKEDGTVLWQRKVFFPCSEMSAHFDFTKGTGSLYDKVIQAYLYKDVLIINDRINVIGVDRLTGAYVWSMTNQEQSIGEERVSFYLQRDTFLSKYSGKRTFLGNIMFHSYFLDSRLIVLHGSNAYALNPETGYCVFKRTLDITEQMTAAVSADKLYLLPTWPDRLIVLDKALNELHAFPLHFFPQGKKFPAITVAGDYSIFHQESEVFLMDNRNGQLTDKFTLGRSGMGAFVEVHGGRVVVIIPLESIASYSVEEGKLKLIWQHRPEAFDVNVSRNRQAWKNKAHYFFNDSVVMPFRKNGRYVLVCLDARSGKMLWEQTLGHPDTVFINMSSYQYINDTLFFIFGTLYDPHFKNPGQGYFADVFSTLFGIAAGDGKVRYRKKLPLFCSYILRLPTTLQTRDYFIYTAEGYLLEAKRKDECEK